MSNRKVAYEFPNCFCKIWKINVIIGPSQIISEKNGTFISIPSNEEIKSNVSKHF